MSVKFVKVRFNLNKPGDKAVYEIIKSLPAQNEYIKNAITSYYEQKQSESLTENIVAAVRKELSKFQLAPLAAPAPTEVTTDTDPFDESADIADAFLDCL